MDFEGSRWVSTKRENSNFKSSFILHPSSSFFMLLRKWKGETTKKTTLWTASSKKYAKKHNTFWEKKFSPKANAIENQLLELKNRKIPPWIARLLDLKATPKLFCCWGRRRRKIKITHDKTNNYIFREKKEANPLLKVPKKNLLLTKKKTTKDPFGQNKRCVFSPNLPPNSQSRP